MTAKIPVTLARPWKGPDGVTHRPDTTVRVDGDVGRDLILRGLARLPETETDDAAPDGADQEGSPS